MSAVLSLIFISVFFVVCFAFAFHYWERASYKLALRWTVGASICLVIGVFFAARYYLHSTNPVINVNPKERAYVIIRDSKIDPLSPGKGPVLSVLLANTGPVEATGYFRDLSCYFVDLQPKFLTYVRMEPRGGFKLAPNETTIFTWTFDTYVLDDYKIKMLKEEKAKLYIYGRGEYSDERGNRRPITFCREYNAVIPHNLVFCSEDITFKEPEPVNQ